MQPVVPANRATELGRRHTDRNRGTLADCTALRSTTTASVKALVVVAVASRADA